MLYLLTIVKLLCVSDYCIYTTPGRRIAPSIDMHFGVRSLICLILILSFSIELYAEDSPEIIEIKQEAARIKESGACEVTLNVKAKDPRFLRKAGPVFKSEADCRSSQIIAWNNPAENFPSLGIAHTTWYPETKAPLPDFEDSFPKFLARGAGKRERKWPSPSAVAG